MGRSAHHTLDPLSEVVTDSECDRVAAATDFPLLVVKAVLQEHCAVSPALAERFKKALDKTDRHRVSARAIKPRIETMESLSRYGAVPAGYTGPLVVPVKRVVAGMLLMVNDRLSSGWIRVSGAPERSTMRRSDLLIPTESGTVASNENLSVRVAVQDDGDSQ